MPFIDTKGRIKKMINYIEYLNVPTKIAIVLVGLFFAIQAIGELLEFKGKVVPEFIKIRKYFTRKKKERIALSRMTILLEEHEDMAKTILDVKRLLVDIDKHYNDDNIAKRNDWIKEVDEHISDSEVIIEKQGSLMRELAEKLDKNNAVTLSILIENKRSSIIDFASKVIDDKYPVTREQFNRIFKIYEEYEDIIEENGFTNGEVDIAIRIIKEAYESHLKHHAFIEDIRGYNI